MSEFWMQMIVGVVGIATLVINFWWSWLQSKRQVRNWPVGITYVILAIGLGVASFYYMGTQINYGDSLQNLVFLVISIVGWIHWQQSAGADGKINDVRYSQPNALLGWGLFIIVATVGYGYMHEYLHQTLPAIVGETSNYVYFEAFEIVGVVMYNWLIAQKRVEGVVYWVIVSVVVIVHNVLQLQSAYFAFPWVNVINDVILFVIAIVGLQDWHKAAHAYRAQAQTGG